MGKQQLPSGAKLPLVSPAQRRGPASAQPIVTMARPQRGTRRKTQAPATSSVEAHLLPPVGVGEGAALLPDPPEQGRAVAMEAKLSLQGFGPPITPLAVSAGTPKRQIFQLAPLWMDSPAWVHIWRDGSKLSPLGAAVAPLKSLCRCNRVPLMIPGSLPLGAAWWASGW